MIKYYIRDNFGNIIATVAGERVDGIFSRGVAITSPRDNSSKKIGTSIATGRLRIAGLRRYVDVENNKFPAWLKELCYTNAWVPGVSKEEFMDLINTKCQYHIRPTPFEEKLLGAEEKRHSK